jgi:hypothetical protein
METDVNVLGLMLVFLGLGSSLIHYSRFAKKQAIATITKNINNN